MSYQTWHVYGYGYGVNISDIDIDDSKLDKLIRNSNISDGISNELNKLYAEYKNDMDAVCDALTDKYNLSSTYDAGYASMIAYLLEQQYSGLRFTPCTDYDNNQYVLYCPDYPWCETDFEKTLTEKTLRQIFVSFFETITDKPLSFNCLGYHDVENGG